LPSTRFQPPTASASFYTPVTLYDLWNCSNCKWYVQGWPNIFLIDAKGIIRQHWVGSPGTDVLDQQLEKLEKEVSAKAAPEK